MSKRWWESQTIRNAIYAFIVALSGTGWAAYQEGEITREHVAIVSGAAYTLKQTIEGRIKASTNIGDDKTLPVEAINTPIEMPNLDDIHRLPNTVVVDEDSAVANLENIEQEGELTIELANLLDAPYTIKAVRSTKIKTSDNDSSLLSLKDYQKLEEGNEFTISSWSFVEMSNHIKIQLEEDGEFFFIYVPHIRLINSKGGDVSIESADPDFIRINKTPFNLPGYSSTFYLEDSVIADGHFYWSEVTKNGTRIPESRMIVENILALAQLLEDVRSRLGNRPITVTSWYRPPEVNRAVGGATKSKHLTGGAVDIVVQGLSAGQVQDILRPVWNGGIGLARTFTHLDLGPKRVWRY